MKKFMAMAMALAVTVGVAFAESAAISSSAYDAAKQVLTVTFSGGEVYEYAGVPQAVADALSKAESKGETFHNLIKGKFPAKTVGGEKPAAE